MTEINTSTLLDYAARLYWQRRSHGLTVRWEECLDLALYALEGIRFQDAAKPVPLEEKTLQSVGVEKI